VDVPFPLGIFFSDLSVALNFICSDGIDSPVRGVPAFKHGVRDEVVVGHDEVGDEVHGGRVFTD
jgi:hypothetical protein